MKNEESRMKKFEIKTYRKSELAIIYFPDLSKKAATKKLRSWLKVNPRLVSLIKPHVFDYQPKQVRQIVDEVGLPNDYYE